MRASGDDAEKASVIVEQALRLAVPDIFTDAKQMPLDEKLEERALSVLEENRWPSFTALHTAARNSGQE